MAFMKDIALGDMSYYYREPSKAKRTFSKTYTLWDKTFTPNQWIYPDDVDDGIGPFPFKPYLKLPSQCFAGYNPAGPNSKQQPFRSYMGLGGTSGIFCSWADFPLLYQHRNSFDYGYWLCSTQAGAVASIKAPFKSRFGSSAIPSDNVTGEVIAQCAWDPWLIDGNFDNANNLGGSCVLASHELSKTFSSSTCINNFDDGIANTFRFEKPGCISKCRKYLYGCEGGNQGLFGMTGDGSSTRAYCSNHKISGSVGDYDHWFCPMRPPCVSNFRFPWHPKMESPDSVYWISGTSNLSSDSLTRYFFRLPALDTSKLQCKPSPFVNATNAPPRRGTAPWSPVVPVRM